MSCWFVITRWHLPLPSHQIPLAWSQWFVYNFCHAFLGHVPSLPETDPKKMFRGKKEILSVAPVLHDLFFPSANFGVKFQIFFIHLQIKISNKCRKQKLPGTCQWFTWRFRWGRDAFTQKNVLTPSGHDCIPGRKPRISFGVCPTSMRQAALPRWVAMMGRDLRMEIAKMMMTDKQ